MTSRAALMASVASIGAVAAWTVTASAALLALGGQWSSPYFAKGPHWMWAWASYAADPASRASSSNLLAVSGLGAAALLGVVAVRIVLMKGWGRTRLFGESHFATRHEAEQEGLRFRRRPRPDDLVLGVWRRWPFRCYACFPGGQHVAIYAPTEEGKGVSFVEPNTLNWGGGLVAFSVKRDLVDKCAAERARRGDAVYVFDVGDLEGRTHRWNPLALARRWTPDIVDDLQKVFWTLVPETKATNPYWDNAGRRIATALAVLLAETPHAPLTVAAVATLARQADCARNIRKLVNQARSDGRPYPRAAVDTLLGWAEGLDANGEEARGVRQTILTALALWEGARVPKITEASDFDLRDLRNKKMSVFVCAPQADIDRMRPLYAVFFQQLVDVMAREEFSPVRHRHRVLALLDEFWALGRIRVLADAAAFIRSSGLRLAIVVQSKDQTRTAFGPEGSRNLYGQMGVEIALGGLDPDQAKEVSERAGTNTEEAISTGKPRFFGWLHPSKQHQHTRQQGRALLLAQEIQRLPRDKMIVLRRRLGPLLLTRIYRDPLFEVKPGITLNVPALQFEIERDTGKPQQISAEPRSANEGEIC